MSGEKEQLRETKTTDRKKGAEKKRSTKDSKKLNHVTLPWGVDPIDEKKAKAKRDSLAKTPPPHRKVEKNNPENTLPFDINTLYPDEVVEVQEEEKTKDPPGKQAAGDNEDSVVVEEVSDESPPSDSLDDPHSKTMPMEPESFDDPAEKTTPTEEVDEKAVPPLETAGDSLEQRLKALGESEDRAKLKFIIAISSVVVVGLAVVLTVLFVTARGPGRDSKSGKSASVAAKPPRGGGARPTLATGRAAKVKPRKAPPKVSPSPSGTQGSGSKTPRAADAKPQTKAKAAPPAKKAKASAPDRDTVLIRIGGVPRDGEVYINDKRAKRPYRVPKSNKAIKIEVRAPGRASVKKRVVPNRDKVVSVHMKRL